MHRSKAENQSTLVEFAGAVTLATAIDVPRIPLQIAQHAAVVNSALAGMTVRNVIEDLHRMSQSPRESGGSAMAD